MLHPFPLVKNSSHSDWEFTAINAEGIKASGENEVADREGGCSGVSPTVVHA